VTPLLLSLLIGAAGACGFQPLGLWPITLLSLAMFMSLIERAPNLRGALVRGWLFGLGYFCVGLNWIATSFTYQANMPAWLGWVAVVLLSFYLSVYPAIAAGLAWRIGRSSRIALILMLAGGWIVTEWLRATMFTGFAWNPLGAALVGTPWAWVAKLVGTYGLSAFATLLGGAIYLFLRKEWRSGGAIALVLAIVALASLFQAAAPVTANGVRIHIVQPNIGQDEKWQEGSEARAVQRLVRLSRHDPNVPTLLLWPEAAVTRALQDARRDVAYRESTAELRRTVAAALGPKDLLLSGGITLRSSDGIDVTSATNSVFAIDPAGRIMARFDKNHLVPYGEYLPMRPVLSRLGLSRLAPGDVDFDPGPGPMTLQLPLAGRVGFQVCYEIIFSGHVVDRAHRPDFIFNPSNDAWFGAWGPPQHLAQARLRALEEGLPVIRSTPTGISAVIDARGNLLNSLPWRKEGVIDTTLPPPAPPTLFARYGNMLPLAFAFLLGIGAIAARRKTR